MDLKLKGKRALVTGGSRGIGKAIARALAQEGVRVLLSSRDGSAATAAAEELARETGSEVHAFVADTRDDAQVDALVAHAVAQLGGLDIVVNNAARPGAQPQVPGVAGVASDYLLDELNTKLVGYLRIARAAAPHLLANSWGRIINISGLAARQTGTIPGSTRNVAIAALTKGLADELGPKGVNVTVVHPGATRTEKTADAIAHKAAADGISQDAAEKILFGQSLIGRIVEAEEVAAVVTFLASPLSVAINGDAIAAGGGSPRAIHY
ncbi:SDR family NAD(P)-dependent oxidoreductase [Sphingobium sp. YR768]|uniref:SDR family NAD(P)-dependent oxidoreductase n=1 Tax=Sphingobium sp. YR768 TaxID=1884365 RepID=UPI0008D2764C|nr:SDR family NAD(P)-dependent oxidoreductase [Sphingobium sp. YR768]SES20331.1 NAD(P)-dependent dehydrogenase, short-chain alcohol dehydrogenase family [Sphingobium sp. YR768]